jgi:hypothetical protein
MGKWSVNRCPEGRQLPGEEAGSGEVEANPHEEVYEKAVIHRLFPMRWITCWESTFLLAGLWNSS